MPAKARRGLKDFGMSDFDLIGGERGKASLSVLSFGRDTVLLLRVGESVGDGDRGISAIKKRSQAAIRSSIHLSAAGLTAIRSS